MIFESFRIVLFKGNKKDSITWVFIRLSNKALVYSHLAKF